MHIRPIVGQIGITIERGCYDSAYSPHFVLE